VFDFCHESGKILFALLYCVRRADPVVFAAVVHVCFFLDKKCATLVLGGGRERNLVAVELAVGHVGLSEQN
jgi:hypothetical protein